MKTCKLKLCRWFRSRSVRHAVFTSCYRSVSSSLHTDSTVQWNRWRSKTSGCHRRSSSSQTDAGSSEGARTLSPSFSPSLSVSVSRPQQEAHAHGTHKRAPRCFPICERAQSEREIDGNSLSRARWPPGSPSPPPNTQLPSPILHLSALLTALLPPPSSLLPSSLRPPLPSCPDLLTHKLAAPPVNTESSWVVSCFIFTLHGQKTSYRHLHNSATMKLFKPNRETSLCGAADTRSVFKQKLCKKFPSCHISFFKLTQTMQHHVAQLWDVGQQARGETSLKSTTTLKPKKP